MIETGTLLQNRYRVVRQIGQGGMGAVYVATDERFRSTVAIKQTFFDDPVLRKAFEREAHLLNHLRHAALPKVSDHFDEGAGQFLVMEFIEGSDFSELLQERNGAFPLADVLRWADEVLDALEYLHTQEPPVVHRDIKPQNLKLTTRGKVFLLDFGLAKGAQQAQTHASTTASVFGYSRNYAPLEQMQGTGTDPRSDLYSLGATLYHLLTGAAPVDALTRAGALVNQQPDPLRPAHLTHAQVPAAVGKIIHRAMAQSATLRPSTASEMRAALRQAATSASPYTARQTPAAVFPQGLSASDEATVLETLTEAPGDYHPDAALSTKQKHLSPTTLRETTVVDGAHGARRRPARTNATHDLFPPLPPPVTSARKSHKLLVGAVIALIVAFTSIPLILSRRSGAPPADSGAQTATPPGTTTGAQSASPSAATQGSAGGESPSAADSTPATTQGQAARPAGETTTTTNAQPVPGDAATGASPFGGSTALNETNRPTATGNTEEGRPAPVVKESAPNQSPVSEKTGYEEEIRRLEEERRERERPAVRPQPAARPQEDRNPPPFREPPPPHFPPPGGERRPPPHRPPPFR